MVTTQNFTLLIVDECHNTAKNSHFAQIMDHHLESREIAVCASQVVGLTATPNLGKNPDLSAEKAIEDLVTLCARMDVSSGIQTVKEYYIDELNEVLRKPKCSQDVIVHGEQRQVFIQCVEQVMKELETFLSFSAYSRSPCWS